MCLYMCIEMNAHTQIQPHYSKVELPHGGNHWVVEPRRPNILVIIEYMAAIGCPVFNRMVYSSIKGTITFFGNPSSCSKFQE